MYDTTNNKFAAMEKWYLACSVFTPEMVATPSGKLQLTIMDIIATTQYIVWKMCSYLFSSFRYCSPMFNNNAYMKHYCNCRYHLLDYEFSISFWHYYHKKLNMYFSSFSHKKSATSPLNWSHPNSLSLP